MKTRFTSALRIGPAVRGAVGSLLLAVALVAGAAAVALLLPSAEPALVAHQSGGATQIR
jgi:hypothetical protein